MNASQTPFVPPAPKPRTSPPSTLQMLRIFNRNPIELWDEPSYNKRWISISAGFGGPLVIANDPGLIRHVLVDNAKNYKMARMRQSILRPILRDGLLTAENDVWKRSRRTMAPVFRPKNSQGFASQMLETAKRFVERYETETGTVDVARDMTLLTYEILSGTLFSGEIAGGSGNFGEQVARLFETMGRLDPLDLLGAPVWVPRITRIRGRRSLVQLRKMVADARALRKARLDEDPTSVPNDFLTLLLKGEGPKRFSAAEIEDNIITFIVAGHETAARALGWTLYCLSEAPWERDKVEAEIDRVLTVTPDPVGWLDAMPMTRAVFEEAMRLYPPIASISRDAIEDDSYADLKITKGTQIQINPWTVHRHRKFWDRPDAFLPERFHPDNRKKIDCYQFLPFGAGPRICIGASFALQEAVIALVVLLSRYRFDTISGTRPWPVQKLTTQPQGGLPMRVSPRQRSDL